MKIRTSELTGPALDWAVAKALGKNVDPWHKHLAGWLKDHRYSTDWAQGGPIIGREQISLTQFKGHPSRAHLGTVVQFEHAMFAPEGRPLTAAMRCLVASKLGEEVEVPDELC